MNYVLVPSNEQLSLFDSKVLFGKEMTEDEVYQHLDKTLGRKPWDFIQGIFAIRKTSYIGLSSDLHYIEYNNQRFYKNAACIERIPISTPTSKLVEEENFIST